MRVRYLVVLVVATTVLACTAGDETGDGQAPGTVVTDQPSVEPRWTQVELPRDTGVSQARIAFGGGVLAGTEHLPHMVAGVAAEPGMPDQVRIWTSGNAKRWDTTDVAMRDRADAQVTASASDGRSTAVIGSTWTAEGGLRPFVLVSDDRQTWEEAALPEQASRRAVDPEAIALDADGAPLLVGTDVERRPVAVLVDGDGGGVVDLPAPDEGDVGFKGVAVDGDTVVAVAHMRPPDGPTYPVTFRSTDAGRTWRMQKGPGDGIAGVTGIARAGDHFVVTGWVSDDAGTSKPAAWQSADGRRWTAEDLDLPELSDLDVDHWPVAPAVRGNRLVAAMHTDAVAPGVLFDRDAAGRWTVRWSAERLVASETEGHAAAAPLADGTALVALWARNSGTIGVIEDAASCDATCSWTTALDTIGPDDPGMEWAELVLDGDVPVVVGSNWVVTELDEFSWNTRRRLSRWSFVDGATVAPVAWDPPESGDLTQVKVASDGSGATAVLGTKSSPDERVADADEVVDEADVVGWFRPAADAAWTPAKGLARRRYESLRDVFRVGDQWIAVGAERNNGAYQAHEHATVWASRDGVRWRYQDGPFDVAADRNSWADGACQLPGDGDTLVVGGVEAPGDDRSPVAWRHTDDGWTQVEQSRFDTNRGSLLSCTRHGDTTVVQGSVNGRSTLWRTTDGETFERRELSPSDAFFSLVRPVTSGFAAAGNLDADRERGAVVWLSPDGVAWRAVAVPSDRRLSGWDVLDWDGRLVVAATSTSDPEIWILENASELLDTIDSGAPPDDGGS